MINHPIAQQLVGPVTKRAYMSQPNKVIIDMDAQDAEALIDSKVARFPAHNELIYLDGMRGRLTVDPPVSGKK